MSVGNRKILTVIAILISGVSILYVAGRLSSAEIFTAFSAVQMRYVVATGILIIIGVIIRSVRWGIIAGYAGRNIPAFFKAYSLGYLGNMIYPARAGELLRIAYIRRVIDIPPGYAVSSAASDRILDGVAFSIALGIFFWVFGEKIAHAFLLQSVGVAFLILSCGILFFTIAGDRLPPIPSCIKKAVPERFLNWIVSHYNQGHAGLKAAMTWRTWVIVIALSLISFGIDCLGLWVLISGFGLDLPLSAGVLMMFFFSVSSLIPSAPGYLGPYQIASIIALSPFGVSDSVAVACSLVMMCINMVMFGFLSGGALLRLPERTFSSL